LGLDDDVGGFIDLVLLVFLLLLLLLLLLMILGIGRGID